MKSHQEKEIPSFNIDSEPHPLCMRIQFRHMPKSESIRQLVRQQADRLGRFELNRGHCEVVVDEMHHWNKGGIYRVSLHLKLPGEPVYVACAEEQTGSYEYLYGAVRRVFEEVELQLKKRRRRAVRRRPDCPVA